MRRMLGQAAASVMRVRSVAPSSITGRRINEQTRRDLDEVAGLAGLEWRQALVLGALERKPQRGTKLPGFVRAFLLRYRRVRGAMERCEQLGFIEPGWTVGTQGTTAVITESGKRVAHAVLRAVGVEEYPGEPRRFIPR